ncbi:hypothetical protein ColLi_12146 [Colletotrichum liriopes]|uniref:Uncharacterized protein n=1 Tax=Colletotrichum liriopes TaxID=708192 RepID=A0AA37LZC3_9PEZI|nr:hypothetical protein ColLi_12146 [Colletotrichum liriopes]
MHKKRQLLDAGMIGLINKAKDERLDADDELRSEQVQGAEFNIVGFVCHTIRQAGWAGVSSSEAKQQSDAAETAWRQTEDVASVAEAFHDEQQQLRDFALAVENLDLVEGFLKSSDAQALMAEDE